MNVWSSGIALSVGVYLFLLIDVVCPFQLTLLHTNDVHARFEQFTKYGTACKADDATEGKCFGGVSRRKTKVREIRASHNNVLLLDAGDQFLGTLWFTLYKGLAASHFMKEIGYDAMCLGNHEFDLGVDGLVTFLDNVTFPVLSANTDVTEEPRLQGKFASSHVFTVGGEKVGVIGFITPETAFISNAGPTVSFQDVLTSVQTEVTLLTNNGVNKIIALGHAGYGVDQQVAKLDGVDIVIGGHTNTFLYTGDDPSNEMADGEYPTVVTKSSAQCLVVQAFTWGKYLGYLNVTFDTAGEITDFSGNPILLDSNVHEDSMVLQEVQTWAVPIQEINNEVVGYTKVPLDGSRQSCRLTECSLGNLFLDAVIDYHLDYAHSNTSWAPAAIALWNGGGIRASINQGPVTVGEIMTVLPFGNEIDLIEVRGSNLREQIELSVRDWHPTEAPGRFLQFSGLKVVYDLTQPAGQRVITVNVRCLQCDVLSYSPLQDDLIYKLFTSSFIVRGGDGYSFDPVKIERFNTLETDVLTKYMQRHSPVIYEAQGRITFSAVSASSASRTMHSVLFVVVNIIVALI